MGIFPSLCLQCRVNNRGKCILTQDVRQWAPSMHKFYFTLIILFPFFKARDIAGRVSRDFQNKPQALYILNKQIIWSTQSGETVPFLKLFFDILIFAFLFAPFSLDIKRQH